VEASSETVAERASPVDGEAAEERRLRDWPAAIAILGPALILYLIAGTAVYWLIGIIL
jgi:hypothetical protein